MNKETFFKIINNHFQKNEVKNFHGILITPVFDNENITFDFENPNNLSFNKSILSNYFHDECDMFGKILGIEENDLYNNYVRLKRTYYNSNRIFLNDSDKQELTNITKKHVNKIIIDISRYDVSLSADISVVGVVQLSSDESESTRIEVELKFENLTNPKKPSYDLNRNISVLRGWFYNDYNNYDEITDTLFHRSYDFVTSNPLLFNDEYMYIGTNVTLIVYDEEGKLADF